MSSRAEVITQAAAAVIDSGTLTFSIESRILRELGERLVKQPEVALLELVKNAYDADAITCTVDCEPPRYISVEDDGHGMTLDEFEKSWMRIGTSSKEASPYSRTFARQITGEKGIGRFAVRFLGRHLQLETIADDNTLGIRTLLIATFNWPEFDQNEDLGKVKVPYTLAVAPADKPTGTKLIITQLRNPADAIEKINMRTVRTASMGIVTPYRALLRETPRRAVRHRAAVDDPGFSLTVLPSDSEMSTPDVAQAVLDSFVLRAVLELKGDQLNLTVHDRWDSSPRMQIRDRFPNKIGPLYADIRFFPRRKGALSGLPIDGRRAKSWVTEHSGIAVFDRTFRVYPYGDAGDDWLSLAADTARRERDPKSSIAKKHFPMDAPTYGSTKLNYMLRLPYPYQLVGIVQVEGRRVQKDIPEDEGLIPAADREGFVANATYHKLWDVVRGAVEAIAASDRELQLEQEREQQEELIARLRDETKEAIEEIESNPRIARSEKRKIIGWLAQTRDLAETYETQSREREATLQTMSLLGVVAGFMTHEFETALDVLIQAQDRVAVLARRDAGLKTAAAALAEHIGTLQEFFKYSQGYIHGATSRPLRPYPAKPRIQQVERVFGKYAAERDIKVQIDIAGDVLAPLVPVALYNGIALNLYTNALKAVTAKLGNDERKIAFRAWNEQQWHFLEVSDTGIGIPSALRERVFDPLFTTTANNRDPLGSGMGLGLALVKRGAEAYGGRAEVVEPPPTFVTCVRIKLPLTTE
jgi:signal transduction histidine kinase